MYVKTINGKEAMKLKENREGFIAGFGGRNGRRKCSCTLISKIRKIF